MEDSKKWYQKPAGIIAFLVLFFPVGLYLMWKYADWHKYVKWGITGFFALIFIWSSVSSALGELIDHSPPPLKTPVITLNDFESDKTVNGAEYALSGKVDPPSTELKVNGRTVKVKEDGSFTYTLPLKEGANEIKIEANNSGKTAELVRKLTRELTAEEKAAEAKRKAEEEAKKKAEEEAKKKAKESWTEVLYDIVEWNKNNGEHYTDKFKIESDTWRVKWAKRQTTQMVIEVYTPEGTCVPAVEQTICKPDYYQFTADFNQSDGVRNFKGSGTYYIRMVIGTSKDAGSADIRVEELK